MRVKPSRSSSAMGFIVGLIFIGIGLFIVIPTFGAFGIFWTLIACVITATSGMNAFSKRGVAMYEVEFDRKPSVDHRTSVDDLESKLKKLARLKEQGLITQAEYDKKRAELLDEEL